MDKPKLVFFFDEAHLLFNEAPPALLEKIEQVVRLIRSKGVGVYFVTQNPLDIPDTVLGQLGNRVQHALRAFTPRDQKAVKTAAETLRSNPAFDAAAAITELGVGEAVSYTHLDVYKRQSVDCGLTFTNTISTTLCSGWYCKTSSRTPAWIVPNRDGSEVLASVLMQPLAP